ncbi:putative F-box domain-containing protein [Arabidopsis thaliana]
MMRRRNKKTKTVISNPETLEERNKFDEIPHDLVIEILGRLPAKSVARFLTVSKLWATSIRSLDFIKSYPLGSSSKPRTLVASKQVVANPSTGRTIPLPRVKTRRTIATKVFSAYGDLRDESSQHQVFTLGAKKKSFRMIDTSIIPHRPCSNGVCIDSVVYYVAKTGAGMLHLCIMRFDLSSEILDLFTSLPQEIRPPSLIIENLINYEGKLAIPTETTSYTYVVWVIDQDSEKHECLKKLTFSIEPAWKNSFVNLRLIGYTTHTCEFILHHHTIIMRFMSPIAIPTRIVLDALRLKHPQRSSFLL